jgi:hypothetical protein
MYENHSMGMPLRLFNVREEFRTAMEDPRNLVGIHRDLRQGPGRRTREVALNRAIVMFSVGAWQAYVQDAVTVSYDLLEPPLGQPQGWYQVLRGLLVRAVEQYNTPNAENTRNLLLHVGFDPWPVWTWREGPIRLSAPEVRTRLNRWLRVRHTIAHGDDLPHVPMLRLRADGTPSLRLANAEACIAFFERLVNVTTAGLAQVVGP